MHMETEDLVVSFTSSFYSFLYEKKDLRTLSERWMSSVTFEFNWFLNICIYIFFGQLYIFF